MVYEIDGARFQGLNGFYDEIERVLEIEPAAWGRNLDAFNDVLRGEWGTPSGGFVLVWKNAIESAKRLGYEETVWRLKLRLRRCHPGSRSAVSHDLAAAEARIGPTVFDWLVNIIREHPLIELRLE